MVRKQIPISLWHYGLKWVSEIISLTHASPRGIHQTPLSQVIGDTACISEYIDFGIYDQFMYHTSAGMGPKLPGRWLGVFYRIGNLMCHYL